MKKIRRNICSLAAPLSILCSTAAVATPVFPAGLSTPQDLGATSVVEGNRPVSVTIALKLRDANGAEQFAKALHDPANAAYRHFLTPAQFEQRFGPADSDVDNVIAAMRRYGVSVTRSTSTTLKVTGSPAAIESAFKVSLHSYQVTTRKGQVITYHAPVDAPTVPAEVSTMVNDVVGLNTQPRYHSNIRRAAFHATGSVLSQQTTANAPGSLTVADFAAHYDVKPLYASGVNGQGSTIGIVTLASFTPSDAFKYWSAVGLTVDPKRLKVVNIDGGPGAPSDLSGSDETTLDVEQSGGIAPGAKMVVYQAANTNQAFLDAFARAIDSNEADSISVSWGSWEWFNNVQNSPVADPYTGKTVGTLQAFHELFLQAAIQGQSLFSAAGDAGAYDVNDGSDANGLPLTPPYYSLALSVDYPASDPMITAAGGTTLAATLTIPTGTSAPPLVVNIPQERVWGWDYLDPLCKTLNLSPIACGIFPVGGGGGVSVEFNTPSYQAGLQGVQRSQPGQVFVNDTVTPAQTVYALPANFAGRNVPDISANADPNTGYVVYYTSDQTGYGVQSGWGGTSFVAPQMNGVTALLNQYVGGRIGLLNFPLYSIAQNGGYFGNHAPLRAIMQGNNGYYQGSNGYNPGAGLGVLDVTNLAKVLR